jgi:drug/metabolite transporter (DMT)-like permease
MINSWKIASGVFTLVFFLAAFYFLIIAGVRERGKRGWLIILAVALLGPGFLFGLISEVYENESAALLSHGMIVLSGILFLLSIYLSKLELEKGGEVAE